LWEYGRSRRFFKDNSATAGKDRSRIKTRPAYNLPVLYPIGGAEWLKGLLDLLDKGTSNSQEMSGMCRHTINLPCVPFDEANTLIPSTNSVRRTKIPLLRRESKVNGRENTTHSPRVKVDKMNEEKYKFGRTI